MRTPLFLCIACVAAFGYGAGCITTVRPIKGTVFSGIPVTVDPDDTTEAKTERVREWLDSQ